MVSDPPQDPPGGMPTALVGDRLRAPMPPLGVHGHLLGSIPIRFWIDGGHSSFCSGILCTGDAQKRKRFRAIVTFFKLAREPSQRLARGCRPSWPPPSTDRLRDDASACQCARIRLHRSAEHAQRQSVVALASQSVEPQQAWTKAVRG